MFAVAALALCVLASPRAPQQAQSKPADPRSNAEALVQQGRYAEAQAQLEVYLKAKPSDAPAWNMLGTAHHALKHYDAAADAFERARTGLPGELTVLRNLGVAQFMAQRLDAAKKTFDSVLAADARDARSHLFLARIALIADDSERALREFQAATAEGSTESTAFFHYGMYLMQERQLDDAQRMFERAIALDAEFASAFNALGLVLQRKGDSVAAKAKFQRFRDLTEVTIGDERRRARVTSLLKAAYKEIENGNIDAALDATLDAAREGPEFAIVQQTLASIYKRLGREDDARVALERFNVLSAKAGAK